MDKINEAQGIKENDESKYHGVAAEYGDKCCTGADPAYEIRNNLYELREHLNMLLVARQNGYDDVTDKVKETIDKAHEIMFGT